MFTNDIVSFKQLGPVVWRNKSLFILSNISADEYEYPSKTHRMYNVDYTVYPERQSYLTPKRTFPKKRIEKGLKT